MTFEDIEKDSKILEDKVKLVEQETDLVKRRELEMKIFTPKDLFCTFKKDEIKY